MTFSITKSVISSLPGLCGVLWKLTFPDSDQRHQNGPHSAAPWRFREPQDFDYITSGGIDLQMIYRYHSNMFLKS